jgi:hypothetical protein
MVRALQEMFVPWSVCRRADRAYGLFVDHSSPFSDVAAMFQSDFRQRKDLFPLADGSHYIAVSEFRTQNVGLPGSIDMSDIGFENISISPRVKQTESEDGAVLLDIEQGICFSLNAVGLKIWEKLRRQSPIGQIADSLAQEFHIPRDQIMADVCDFVAQLESKHLIARKTEPVQTSRWWTCLRFMGKIAHRKN